VDQITVALDSAGDLLAEVWSTVKGVLNGLHGKVSVTSVNNFKDKNKTLLFRIFMRTSILEGLDYNLSMIYTLCISHPLPFSL
jgi:hypothetical protein